MMRLHFAPKLARRASRTSAAALALAVSLACSASVVAAEEGARGGAAAVVDEITVTATKKSDAEAAQTVPVAISAFGDKQLEAMQVRDLESLTFSIPNVSLDSIGTTKGVANFSIRGLGVNSSIPSIDPTVGVFVDGMYLGVNFGVVFDTFDLEAIEVLRGPQGVLFGRNVTGGAVLLRTKRPEADPSASVKWRTQSPLDDGNLQNGLDHTVAAHLNVPLMDNLFARVAIQNRDNAGWFQNDGGSDPGTFGADHTFMVRPSLTLLPFDGVDMTLRHEHGEIEADGPAGQNRAFYSDFDFAIDEPGFVDAEWNQVILETNIDVGFGDGKITNITGWREVDQTGLSDIDATNNALFHAGFITEQEQVSSELRYAGRFFDQVDLTTGLYAFNQQVLYRERRQLLGGAIDSTLGGDQDHFNFGLFTQADVDITPSVTGIVGVRYTYEDKNVDVATFSTAASPCGELSTECDFDFKSEDSWHNVSPKVGLQWWAQDETQVYGTYTRGFRSGGYNLRNTSPTAEPGPYDEETQDSLEFGVKTKMLDNRLRLNVAAFYNMLEDLQREVNLPDAATGVVQIIKNTADASIYGIEADASFLVTPQLALTGSVGWTDAEYDDVKFDISGDGVVDGKDEDLDLPRLANITGSVGATYDQPVGETLLATLRTDYSYRDESFYTDNNQGTLPDGHVINAGVTLAAADVGGLMKNVSFTLFGKNLLNEAFRGGDTQLPDMIGPAPLGGTFSPLKEGRVIGLEARIDL